MLKLFSKRLREEEKRKEKWRKENQDIFEKRMNNIKLLASRNMRKGELPNGLPHKEHVVVPYTDLLSIWDIADRAKWDTTVG